MSLDFYGHKQDLASRWSKPVDFSIAASMLAFLKRICALWDGDIFFKQQANYFNVLHVSS